ncbi:response regulator transcription factor [Mycolicibacterium psychrotolerans]|uniref:DNA-binding response regulator n=1 Tax=Mycolicibacterium psychrotolerans TaxID=216929 RepID=A0A7I7MF85_9MYCO|nr:response regulator transcription factor [Mycolicibacterium psychrotolerans]BBX70835.1 DNA-binding response regulator [Mycolicibacterium psychrotolerans]
MAAILVAEADPRLSTMIRKGFRAEGLSTTIVADGLSGYSYARRGNFDLVVLDTRLPGLGGLEVLRRLRAEGCTLPAVLLTPCGRVGQTVAELDTSTEQFASVAPLRFGELLAAVRSHLRRRPAAEPAVLCYGGLTLDLRTRRAHVGDYSVDLSVRECDLAEASLRSPGQVLSRSHLLRQVWGSQEPESNVVDVYVRYLRRKLGSHWFVSSRGVGYRLQAASSHHRANTARRTNAVCVPRTGGRAGHTDQRRHRNTSGSGIAAITSDAPRGIGHRTR